VRYKYLQLHNIHSGVWTVGFLEQGLFSIGTFLAVYRGILPPRTLKMMGLGHIYMNSAHLIASKVVFKHFGFFLRFQNI